MGVLFERGMDVDAPHWIDIFDNEKFEQFMAESSAKAAGKDNMEDKETLKAEVKKLNARAMEARMALHDLSEELPAGLDTVMDVAQQTVAAFLSLEAARKKLAAATA
ncbi:MAG TPA: CCE_0567 family metalloprotein [Thiobacillus sp.]|nr:CCE_0567 family metalloprotein [Thiobacillus sp.]